MQEVYERVFVTDATSCLSGSDGVAVVHACKSPCHQRAVGYTGKIPKRFEFSSKLLGLGARFRSVSQHN